MFAAAVRLPPPCCAGGRSTGIALGKATSAQTSLAPCGQNLAALSVTQGYDAIVSRRGRGEPTRPDDGANVVSPLEPQSTLSDRQGMRQERKGAALQRA